MGLPRVRSAYAWSVHQMDSGRTDSRSMKRPVLWSICASTSTMPLMAVSRGARAGCRTGFARSWARMSGEALTSAHWCSSRPRPQGAVADARTVTAVAVPLREAATGGGAQHTYLHSRARAGGLAAPRRTGLRSPAARLPALAHLQRFAMYIVISIPKRKSVARGVSQRIVLVPALGQLNGIHRDRCILPRRRGERKRIIMKVAS